MNTLIALTVALTFPPASTNAVDSEVVTNVVWQADASRPAKLRIPLELDALPDVNLEIGVGTDRNGDGRLDLLEVDRFFGYDCGSFYAADTLTGRVVAEPATANAGRVSHEWLVPMGKTDRSWNMARLVRRGTGDTNERGKLRRLAVGTAIFIR